MQGGSASMCSSDWCLTIPVRIDIVPNVEYAAAKKFKNETVEGENNV